MVTLRNCAGDVITGVPPLFNVADAVLDHAVVFHHTPCFRTMCYRFCGGRVLCVTALADSVKPKRSRRCTRWRRASDFDGAQYRRDIGYRAVRRGGVGRTNAFAG